MSTRDGFAGTLLWFLGSVSTWDGFAWSVWCFFGVSVHPRWICRDSLVFFEVPGAVQRVPTPPSTASRAPQPYSSSPSPLKRCYPSKAWKLCFILLPLLSCPLPALQKLPEIFRVHLGCRNIPKLCCFGTTFGLSWSLFKPTFHLNLDPIQTHIF